MEMKAKIFRLDEIPERFWDESGDYPHAEVCTLYCDEDEVEIQSSVFKRFEKTGSYVYVNNPKLTCVKSRKMLCWSLGDYLYLIRADRIGFRVLWRVKWDRVEIVDVEGEITKIAIY